MKKLILLILIAASFGCASSAKIHNVDPEIAQEKADSHEQDLKAIKEEIASIEVRLVGIDSLMANALARRSQEEVLTYEDEKAALTVRKQQLELELFQALKN